MCIASACGWARTIQRRHFPRQPKRTRRLTKTFCQLGLAKWEKAQQQLSRGRSDIWSLGISDLLVNFVLSITMILKLGAVRSLRHRTQLQYSERTRPPYRANSCMTEVAPTTLGKTHCAAYAYSCALFRNSVARWVCRDLSRGLS